MSFVTFIVPSIGRSTLDRTLHSLVVQTDRDWTALVVMDAVRNFTASVKDPRIVTLRLQEKLGRSENGDHHAGFVRNYGIGLVVSEWCGFVDDDDRVDPNYVACLRREVPGNDLVVFRMEYRPCREDGVRILPRSSRVEGMGPGEVGISFAVKTVFQKQHDVWFDSIEFEDWIFIRSCLAAGARCKVSDTVAYYVRH